MTARVKALAYGVFGTAITTWFFWEFLLGKMMSMVPPDLSYAWVVKLACIAIVALGGGIAIPLAVMTLTILVILD